MGTIRESNLPLAYSFVFHGFFNQRDDRFTGRTELILFLSKHVDQAIGPSE
jgi:hypothetical protein